MTPPAAARPPASAVERLWGVRNPDVLFNGAPLALVPWPRANRHKRRPLIEPHVVADLVDGPAKIADVDPRALLANQSHVVAHHVRYLTGRWERTGIPAADRDSVANRYPLVVTDDSGRQVILGGHHRAVAALLLGRSLRARTFPAPPADAVAVLPRLLVGRAAAVPAVHLCDRHVEIAASLIRSGQTVLVESVEVSKAIQRRLDSARDR